MATIYFGVADIPYKDKEGETTGQVAQALEARYRIMERFAYAYRELIAEQIVPALVEALIDAQLGGQLPVNPFDRATAEIENKFRLFLDLRELDAAGDPGIPTKASLRGVNHRKAHPYAKANLPRVSFIDSGLYQKSVRVWVKI